ncbi:hypothetical protein AK830_g5137 [Neonectria ditissima]|uniref:Uncharacterized protein n=1 Tax=Neonectria ditissima TaxID=78410 RepID=A0A0P7BLR7_9HYPO|nr:hypothetical protein AK830_g5137 [Neonectria ditissima]
MGQHWKLVNIDKKRQLFNHAKLNLFSHGQLQLREFLLNGIAEQLVGLLRVPRWSAFNISNEDIFASKLKSATSPLVSLPQEIVDLVVSALACSGGEHVICLSLTCSYFFRLLSSSNQTLLIRDVAPWAGDRLILVGDFAEGIPAGIASDDEHREWTQLGENPLYDLPDAHVGENLPPEMPHWMRKGMVERPHMLISHVQERLKEDDGDLQLCARLMQMLTTQSHDTEPSKHQSVLRNLTTKEYILDETIAKSQFAYSLGEVLATFSLWTEEPSGTQSLGCKGIWAGHRFDIATLGEVTEEWTDLSAKAIENLARGTQRPKKDGKRS